MSPTPIGDAYLDHEIDESFCNQDLARTEGLIRAVAKIHDIAPRSRFLESLKPSCPSDSKLARLLNRFLERVDPNIADLMADLDIHDTNPKTGEAINSDWRIVEDAAREVHTRLKLKRAVSEPLLDATSRALQHYHEPVCASVATVLVEAAKRAFLFSEVDTILYRRLVLRLTETATHLPSSRAIIAAAAEHAKARDKASHLTELRRMLARFHPLNGQVLILRDHRVRTREYAISEDRSTANSYRLIGAMLPATGMSDPGPDREVKYGVRQVGNESARLSPLTWADSMGFLRFFQRQIESHDRTAVLTALQLASQFGIEDNPLPGIAVVHAILTSSDDRVLWAVTTDDVMTVSFQEQINDEDLSQNDPLSTCFIRGLREEFGPEFESEIETTVVAAVLEPSIMNIGFLVHGSIGIRSDEMLGRLKTSTEVKEFGFDTAERIHSMLQLNEKAQAVHATAALRLQLITAR